MWIEGQTDGSLECPWGGQSMTEGIVQVELPQEGRDTFCYILCHQQIEEAKNMIKSMK